jgi:hypothetical protein
MDEEQQLPLPMLTYYEAPRPVALEVVHSCKTYREAVRACWEQRTRKSLTRRLLAEEIGGYAPHVTDYLNPDDKASRRDLPAKMTRKFEKSCGNLLLTQWHAWQAGGVLTPEDALRSLLEQFGQRRAA